LALSGVLLAGAAAASERVRLDPAARPRIVNGINTHAFPTTGALLYGGGAVITDDNAATRCSGTLIGCRTFLVASHCVDGDLIASHYRVYLQHAGIAAVASITKHPDYAAATFPLSDVAVVELADWVTGIAPSAINTTADPAPLAPIDGIIVGFGQTQGGGNDYGIKRAGVVETSSCPLDLPSGAGDADLVCWAFTNPIDPPGTDSNTCNGDSGGPLFADLGAGLTLLGVTSGGQSFNCMPDDVSFDANVYAYQSFIIGELAGDATATCGGLPPIDDPLNTVATVDDGLDSVDTSDTFGFNVPVGANALRVALNGEDNGLFDVDLYLKNGPGAGPGDFDCKADGAAVFGACTIDHPTAGSWSMAAVRTAGAGDYQLTATIFGGAAPTCGNGTREFDEQCDGAGDDALCDGLCQADCSCPSPSCGNGVQEVGEACDGADDGACPGECSAACACPPPCTVGDLFDVRARIDAGTLKIRARLLNFTGTYDDADPRDGFSLELSQGANSLTFEVPASDPGWFKSKPEKGRYKWIGALDGLTRAKLVDRTVRQGIWKFIVVGRDVPGAGAFDVDQPIAVRFTLDGRCTDDSF
jgi:hypothetical protein